MKSPKVGIFDSGVVMIRATTTVDLSSVANLEQLIKSYPQTVREVGMRVYDRISPQALADFRREPGKAKQPIDWTSRKQQIAVIIKYKEKGITEWQRGADGERLSAQWQATARVDGDVFTIVYQNPSDIGKFVYGSFAKDKAAALRFMQKFHRNTGWTPAHETGDKWTKRTAEEFKREMKQEIAVKRRAFTQGRRRAT
jgi:hypothetical protein